VTAADVGFERFVADQQRPLLRFATVLSGDPHQADDIVAAVLSRAWEHWNRVTAMDQPTAYVRRMIVNEFLSARRRGSRTRSVADLNDYADASADHAHVYAERGALAAQLRGLPPKQRATLALRFYEDMSDQQIAELLGCSTHTVRSNASRALATLRIRMQEDEQAPTIRDTNNDGRYQRPVQLILKGDI
jgi:RNA polymerase sigma-70 factor (sigma-E family)